MTPTALHDTTVTLRHGRAEDCPLVEWLAELDEAPALRGEVLIAVVDDEPVAALSLHDGRIVANPFVATADAAALLRLRASQRSPARGRRRGWRSS